MHSATKSAAKSRANPGIAILGVGVDTNLTLSMQITFGASVLAVLL
jgi:hypothetical protein